jgi:hypothetical protein
VEVKSKPVLRIQILRLLCFCRKRNTCMGACSISRCLSGVEVLEASLEFGGSSLELFLSRLTPSHVLRQQKQKKDLKARNELQKIGHRN